jgi:transposase InsO family protein
MDEAFAQHGAPRHLISDQESVFISDAFRGLLIAWDVKHRFGAVGKHRSMAVTERVIRTLKCEWLKRVSVIKGLDQLEILLAEFACHYNSWRRHSTLRGAVLDLIPAGEQ